MSIWEPAPEGPPNLLQGSGKYHELYRWLNAHPGEWAKIPDVNADLASTMRKRGYQARIALYKDKPKRGDLYVRKPLTDG